MRINHRLFQVLTRPPEEIVQNAKEIKVQIQMVKTKVKMYVSGQDQKARKLEAEARHLN